MSRHMRTTVRLDDHLLARAKKHAAATGRTLTALIEDALRETMARPRNEPVRKIVSLPTVGGALLPGIDLDDTASLLDAMDRA